MRIIDPQSAVLSNIEVLAYLTANPPRRPPNPPPNSRHWIPSPDLRDHNTVVKEIHNYVSRLSPHLQSYPQYTHIPLAELEAQAQAHANLHNTSNNNSKKDTGSAAPPTLLPPKLLNKPTPIDRALRDLVTRLKPYGLTKGEVLMIVNLGIGLMPAAAAEEGEEEEGETEEYEEEVVEEEGGAGEEGEQPEEMEVDEGATNGGQDTAGAGGENGEAGSGELAEEDYGAMALLDTVIEEREERLSEADVAGILTIIRETLGGGAAAAAAS